MTDETSMIKASLIILLLTMLLSGNTEAQPGIWERSRVQFTFGQLSTLHYDAPTHLRLCVEGCQPRLQESRFSPTVSLAYYYRYHPKQEVSLGIGLTEYRFAEEGTAAPGDYIYRRSVRNKYVSLTLGHRYSLLTQKKITPFVESRVEYERLRNEDYFLKRGALAASIKLGAQIAVTERLHLMAGGSFRSAVIKYSVQSPLIEYYPYGLGGELGVAFN
ncbi:MAG: hypothetical protein KDC80_08795 [Saprospiraceae bacterium]|nr:hypothetical protein [Saprospiraceae bacterium]